LYGYSNIIFLTCQQKSSSLQKFYFIKSNNNVSPKFYKKRIPSGTSARGDQRKDIIKLYYMNYYDVMFFIWEIFLKDEHGAILNQDGSFFMLYPTNFVRSYK